MFSSLRARLWFSYTLLVSVVLAIVALTLLILFIQNPRLIYPEISLQLRQVSDQVALGVRDYPGNARIPALQTYLNDQADRNNVGLIVVNLNKNTHLEAGADTLPIVRLIQNISTDGLAADQVKIIRAKDGSTWLYAWHNVRSGVDLIIAAPTPTLLLRTLLRNELLSSFLVAGAIALLLSFLLALWLGRWIATPLQRMAAASQAMAHGQYTSVPVAGPREAQELAAAMNEMGHRVQITQQSQRDFVANVSHELKTPLTSIQGFAQAILDGAANTPEQLQQAARVIYDESGRMHRLVLDLLSLARLEGGTADLLREPVDLTALLTNIAEKFAPLASRAQVSLHTDLPPLPAFIGDGDRLAQVFTNLVDNAIKFTPSGGEVTLSAHSEDRYVLLEVTDTGSGVPPEDQKRIFERFYQVDRSRKGGSGRGVGLGLSIARQIVLAHSGKIWVENHSPQGSRFVVKLPLAKPNDSTLPSKNKGK